MSTNTVTLEEIKQRLDELTNAVVAASGGTDVAVETSQATGREVIEYGDHGIVIYPPTDPESKYGRYYRIQYDDENGKRQQRKGGTSLETALAKAEHIDDALRRGVEGLGDTSGSDLLKHFLNPVRRKRHCGHNNQQWSESYTNETKRLVDKHLSPVLGGVAVSRWNRPLMQKVINSASTPKEGARLQRTLSAVLSTAVDDGYLDPMKRGMVSGMAWQAPSDWQGDRPTRRDGARESGEASTFVGPDEIIPEAARLAMASAMQRIYKFGYLFYMLALYAGLRLGELLALTCDDFDESKSEIRVWQQVLDSGKLGPPKYNKKRRALVAGGSKIPGGYNLRAQLAERAKQARAEREQCKTGESSYNPLGLIFPSPRGKHWGRSNFRERVFDPAAELTTWEGTDGKQQAMPCVTWTELESGPDGQTREVHRREWIWTLHACRHVFATVALNTWNLSIDVLCTIGGWQTERIVFDTYVGRSEDQLEKARAMLCDME